MKEICFYVDFPKQGHLLENILILLKYSSNGYGDFLKSQLNKSVMSKLTRLLGGGQNILAPQGGPGAEISDFFF